MDKKSYLTLTLTGTGLTRSALLIGVGGVLLASLGGCDQPPPEEPAVSNSLLTGSFAGQLFTAKTALSNDYSPPDHVVIRIYSYDVRCPDFALPDNPSNPAFTQRQIWLTVDKWQDGAIYDLDPNHPVTFSVPNPQTKDRKDSVVTKGRIEVIKAGDNDIDPKGILRLRADGGADNQIEGQVAVSFCPR